GRKHKSAHGIPPHTGRIERPRDYSNRAEPDKVNGQAANQDVPDPVACGHPSSVALDGARHVEFARAGHFDGQGRQAMTTLLDASAKGVYPIAATPFTDTGEIDWPSVDRLVEFYLQCGVQGLTVLGMMGEAQKLSDQEAAELTRHFLRRV